MKILLYDKTLYEELGMKKLLTLGLVVGLGAQLQADFTDLFKKAGDVFTEVKTVVDAPKVYPTTTNVSVEVKNKADEITVVFLEGGMKYWRLGKDKFVIPAGKTEQFSLDISKPLEVQVWRKGSNPEKSFPDLIYKLKQGRTAYMTWDGVQLRPQTGLAKGILGKTDSGLSLTKNIAAHEMTQEK